MKLYTSSTSPFARKVHIVLWEKAMDRQVDISRADPFRPEAAELNQANPLGKIPALMLPSGDVLYDSPVICDYLDQLVPVPRLIPASGADKWRVLKRQALADGIMDAAFNIVMERRRPDAQQSTAWISRWQSAIIRSLGATAALLEKTDADFDLGQIATACALGYLEFRLPDITWPHEKLQLWWHEIAQRPSVSMTTPKVI